MAAVRIANVLCSAVLAASLTVTASAQADAAPLPLPAATDASRSPSIPSLDTDASGGSRWFGPLAALGGIVVLLFALRRFAGAVNPSFRSVRAPAGILEMLGRYPLARGQALTLIRVSGRILLLHQSGERASTLAEFRDAEEVGEILRAVAEAQGESFNARLEKMLHGADPDVPTADVVDLTRRQAGVGR